MQREPNHRGDRPERLDPQNYISAGYTVEPGPGLLRAPFPGTAFIKRQVVRSVSPPYLFPAEKEVYRDLLLDGTFVYQSVPIGAESLPQIADSLCVGKTITDKSHIVQDAILCSYSVQYAPSIEIPA